MHINTPMQQCLTIHFLSSIILWLLCENILALVQKGYKKEFYDFSSLNLVMWRFSLYYCIVASLYVHLSRSLRSYNFLNHSPISFSASDFLLIRTKVELVKMISMITHTHTSQPAREMYFEADGKCETN